MLPTEPARPPRRLVVCGAALVTVGTALATAGCDDPPLPGRDKPANPTPTLDAQTAAAVTTVIGHLTQLSARYAAVARRHPSLQAIVTQATKHHTAQLAKLRALPGMGTPAPTPTSPAVSTVPVTAVKDLMSREQALAVAHATAAATLSGEPARLLASIAANESQLALWLASRKVPSR